MVTLGIIYYCRHEKSFYKINPFILTDINNYFLLQNIIAAI